MSNLIPNIFLIILSSQRLKHIEYAMSFFFNEILIEQEATVQRLLFFNPVFKMMNSLYTVHTG